jgi:hypothetical protein
MHVTPCDNEDHCSWDEEKWQDGVTKAQEGPKDVLTKIRQNLLRLGGDQGR